MIIAFAMRYAGDRVCVDLANLMRPGEGLLVGSFSRGLFLVQSECEESEYINSRPFRFGFPLGRGLSFSVFRTNTLIRSSRVNAGPVHAYVHAPGGRTAYLSELRSGDEVVVVDPEGKQRVAIVGRVKIESRPLVSD